ncbi:MAG TPA: hypothetical protein VLA99_05350 [Nitrospiraceae bacterium]|nr:hypothetical protein [Nitrospiraceae bacterium]
MRVDLRTLYRAGNSGGGVLAHLSALPLLVLLLLSACAEGRWVHPAKSAADVQTDRERCKAEVLAGQEHQKDTMAGGINFNGCMQSKGYRYVEEPASR